MEKECPVLQENAVAVYFFIDMSTQWRYAPSGHVLGIDYNCLFELFKIYDIKKDERAELFNSVRVMEAVVLKINRKK